MSFELWYILVGVLLVCVALAGTLLKRLPLTTALLYLLIGLILGPAAGIIRLDPIHHAKWLERLSEVGVILSLFTAGLKLRTPLTERRWWLPVRLASVSMTVTVALIAAVGVFLLDMPLGVAILLGAILAPTDPVLASDVQVEHAGDRDKLRFSLTGEAGLNDGTAFPFVMLGLGLLHLHELGSGGWRWWTVDVAWSIVGGLGIGAIAGTLVGRLVVHLRRTHREAVGLDEFLSLGLLALSYGVALWLHSYGFLAAFAAGVALRRVEASHTGGDAPPADVGAAATAGAAEAEKIATHPEKAPAYMAQAVLGFNEQIERLCEVGLVLLVGSMLTMTYLPWQALWFVPLLLLVIRPAAVTVGLAGTRLTDVQHRLVSWFGIRGIGSIYYLTYAITHGVGGADATLLSGLTLTTIAVSIAVHGISVTPLMNLYGRLTRARDDAAAAAGATPAAAGARPAIAHTAGADDEEELDTHLA